MPIETWDFHRVIAELEDRGKIVEDFENDSRRLIGRYPFMEGLLALESHFYHIHLLEGIISEEVLERRTHYPWSIHDDGLPSYREDSDDSSMPDKVGPVPSYIVKDGVVSKLGLEYQAVDDGYITPGYRWEARLRYDPRKIKDALSVRGIEIPDYVIFRNAKSSNILFEIYRKERIDGVKTIGWSAIFARYQEIAYHAPPAFESIIDNPACRIECVHEEENCCPSLDDWRVTYFFDFSPDIRELLVLDHSEHFPIGNVFSMGENEQSVIAGSRGALVHRCRQDRGQSISDVIKDLKQSSKRVTHIGCAHEDFRCEKAYSSSMDYVRIDIYDIGDFMQSLKS